MRADVINALRTSQGLKSLVGMGFAYRSLPRCGALLKRVLGKYPSTASRTQPRSWYQRGYGQRYRRRDGTVTGRKTSEGLGKRWRLSKRGRDVQLTNSASYSPFVVGVRQARWHWSHWPQEERTATALTPKFGRIVANELVKDLKKFAG